MLVNQLQHTTPFKRFGFLLLWYASYHGTAIKYTLAMVPHTTVHGDTSVNAVSKQSDTVRSSTTATLQALTRPHFLAAQPASPPPAPYMQPTSTAPATLATQMKHAPAVPTMPAVQKNAPAPMPVTSHARPVQPRSSSHALMAPRCLIQEI